MQNVEQWRLSWSRTLHCGTSLDGVAFSHPQTITDSAFALKLVFVRNEVLRAMSLNLPPLGHLCPPALRAAVQWAS
ncbi:hypothetical protein MPTK1_3g09270 [Marchantia polymorpha subsp. ruderalis]|uniref:Uncharacterized protein n=2 Tax=Marchantia polymorpha TaxID=3197 RepID=A0AAF6AYZ6_MARPO|nr:hypothetical protein MARPO_0085s0102 [Marchantia polymorpha]BBN04980.1 hypothetical protein Mp_3g09270 [Marchantia polymorpha subsp. ruderalis]|eukprot:PTQ33899.1 hypothetical protein MARPO_0085s0102 [Marchantia polymorpha]